LPIVKLLQEMGWFRFNSPVTFFVGENGSGKSTLLEALANKLKINTEGGTKGHYFSTKYEAPGLSRHLQIEKGKTAVDTYFLRAETFYNLASAIDGTNDFDDYGGLSLHEQSHGESFLALVQNRLAGGLYILDEPEAALSPTRQMTLLVEFGRMVQAGAQLIIATHAPILLAFPGAEIYEITGDGIALTAYENCGHVCVTKRFLNDPQGMIRRLME